jgi:hypothetical protein
MDKEWVRGKFQFKSRFHGTSTDSGARVCPKPRQSPRQCHSILSSCPASCFHFVMPCLLGHLGCRVISVSCFWWVPPRHGGLGEAWRVPGPLWLDPDHPDQHSCVASLRVPPFNLPEASRPAWLSSMGAFGRALPSAAQSAMTKLLWAMRLIARPFLVISSLSLFISAHLPAHDQIRMNAYSFTQTKF